MRTCGVFAAVAIVQDGLNAIQRHRDEILVAEAHGTCPNLAWLATCRRRGHRHRPAQPCRQRHRVGSCPSAGADSFRPCGGCTRAATLRLMRSLAWACLMARASELRVICRDRVK
jgi:hypothetical protein